MHASCRLKWGTVTLAVLLANCSSSPPRDPVIGQAFVGPTTLEIRKDIPLRSGSVATVKHGERVEIIQQKRSFIRVRTAAEVEGWTDQRQLLGADDMAGLKNLATRASTLPSQGQAVIDFDLRVHIQPASKSPSFLTLKERDKVEVLTRIVRPKTELPRKPLVPPVPKKPRATKKSKAPKYPLPPPPQAPALPQNWLELSKTDLPDEEPDPPETPPVPTDNWTLIRTPDGRYGWVLSRFLRMNIPDEVAQYAEGHRIVSYFSVGVVQDGDQRKDTWLWATAGGGSHPYDFDSFRVFVWNSRRHRYETGYIERNLTGYLPVQLLPVRYSLNKSGAGTGDSYPGFSICTQKKDGQVARRQFVVLNNLVRFAGEEPCAPLPPFAFEATAASAPASTAPATPKEGIADRLKKHWQAFTKRWKKK